MQGRHLQLSSSALGRDVHLWTYGHFGLPVVVFPTAAGFAHEWDAQGMLQQLAPLLAAGRIKLYCPESNVSESLTRKGPDPRWRIRRMSAYERFVTDTLVPFVRQDCRSEGIRMAAVGASLGGLYAVNMALKHPDLFWWGMGLSGRYEIRPFLQGHDELEVYFHNPLAYAWNLSGDHLERIRRQTRITLVCGQGKYEEGCIEETHALGDLLHHKGIPVHKDIWGHDVSHDWIWWQRQVRHHFGQAFGG